MSDGKEKIITNPHLYKIDGEIGRFAFVTHSILDGNQCQYNTARSIFPSLQGPEFYKTTGFKEIAMIYGDTEQSYRKTAELINRVRYQLQGGTPSRTLHECTEKEGGDVLNHIEEKTRSILAENDFSESGICENVKSEYNNDQPAKVIKTQLLEAIDNCLQDKKDINIEDILKNPVPYEDPKQSTNIAIDDVNVKKQEEARPGGIKPERGKRKYIHNSIAHISKESIGYYVLNGHGIKNVLLFVMAFIFKNGLIGTRMQFFTDGHKMLNDVIFNCFYWYKNIGIILDWFHLEKKCKEQLSLALTGRIVRNEILEGLMPLLWYGLTDEAILHCIKIPKESIKNSKAFHKFIAYLTRNKPYIPCYAVRKELGLCNSSAIGEKMNDLIVSERQKNNGMSWSKSGSVALATISALKRNKESDRWFETKTLDYRLAA